MNQTSINEELISGFFLNITERDQKEFVDPYDRISLKLITILVYIIELLASAITVAFVIYEKDYGHYRTLINQLLSYLYGAVSKIILTFYRTSSL